MSPTLRDASGRVISILHDTNETSHYDSHHMHKSQGFSQRVPFHSLLVPHTSPTHSPYAPVSQRGSMSSYPGTPDLMRSDSYDSQASIEPNSPATPNSACQEPLFSTARNFSHSTSGMSGLDVLSLAARPKEASAPMFQLPPISSLTSLPSPSESKHSAPSPNEAYPYDAMIRHASSSSLEDHHYYRRSLDSHEHYMAASSATSDSSMPRNVESYGDFNSHRVSAPPMETSQVASEDICCDEEDEIMTEDTSPAAGSSSIKKGSKAKAASSSTAAPKRYPCKFRETYSCYKTFTTSGHASRHAKIHTAEKTVPCSWPGCSRRFTRSDNMKQHLETHKKDKPRGGAGASSSSSSSGGRQARRPSLAAIRRQSSASSGRSSVSRYSLPPRETPPLMSPGLSAAGGSMMSIPSPSSLSTDGCWASRPVASRTPSSGLDALAMVAASESELESQARQTEQEAAYYQLYQHQAPRQQ